MQNVEFKAELRDLEAARAQCAVLGATFAREVEQSDTYYRLPDGRLKRRQTRGEPVEWIFYHREDRPIPRVSRYMLYNDEQARTRWGMVPLKPWVTVRKVREIWLLENVRIHFDRVEGLGTFIEFEAQVSRRHDVRRCHDRLRELREAFGPILGEAISSSYGDLVDQAMREAVD